MNGRVWGTGTLLSAILATAGVAPAATIRVPEDQPSIANAIAVAASGDLILVQEWVFDSEPTIDWLGKAVRIESAGRIVQPYDGLYKTGPGSSLATGGTARLDIDGELRSPSSGAADVQAQAFHLDQSGHIQILPHGRLNLSVTDYVDMFGTVTVEGGGNLTIVLSAWGPVSLQGSTMLLDAAQLNVTSGLYSTGTLSATNATIGVTSELVIADNWIMNGGSISANLGLETYSDASLTLYGGELVAGSQCENQGALRVFNGLVFMQEIDNRGEMTLFNTTLSAESLLNRSGEDLLGSGFWVLDLENDGRFTCTDDTTLVGDVVNEGEITILQGSLTILGSLENHGTIIGDYSGPGEDGEYALRVSGGLVAGPAAGLHMPDPAARLRVDREFDVAIDDHGRYDLARSTLTLGSLAGALVDLEVMSEDFGPRTAGLDRTFPGRYPIGRLQLAGATINLVDVHDNDGLGFDPPEAVYADVLQIDAGATLNTNGFRIYYRTLINEGTVSDPSGLIQIVASVPGDVDADGDVDLSDLAALLAAYNACDGDPEYNPDADFDLSGCVDLSDLATLLANYGTVP